MSLIKKRHYGSKEQNAGYEEIGSIARGTTIHGRHNIINKAACNATVVSLGVAKVAVLRDKRVVRQGAFTERPDGRNRYPSGYNPPAILTFPSPVRCRRPRRGPYSPLASA